jgi:hypothetical protein
MVDCPFAVFDNQLVTDRQSFALANPRLDTSDPPALTKFARVLTRGVRKFRTIVTVDRNRKELWWNVSVSVLGADLKPVPISQLSETARMAAERLAHELLGDVGRSESESVNYDEGAVQIMRRVTVEEDRRAKGLERPE